MTALPMGMLKLVNLCLSKLMTQSPGPVLRSSIYSVIGHTILSFKDVGSQILSSINGNDLVQEWTLALDSITHHDRRKISALLYLGKCLKMNTYIYNYVTVHDQNYVTHLT